MNILEDFGLRLKELRSRTGISQDILAIRSGIDQAYITAVERGEHNISLKNIEILCNTLDIDISYFFDDKRFSSHIDVINKASNRPLNERFNYCVQESDNSIVWQVTGELHPEEVKKICVDIKAAFNSLVTGKVKLLIDNSMMMEGSEPIFFSQEVALIWEELQRWLLPHCEQVVVLCNSEFMKNQMDRMAKRSGLIHIQQNLYYEDKQFLAIETYKIFGIIENNQLNLC
ncbi:MAG: helix-turn-helix domain-containing protein [Candidatus Pristimantibacillus sp.]